MTPKPQRRDYTNMKWLEVRSFLLVKTKPGTEKEILERFRALPEVREIHVITGKFDLFVALESEETELDPRRKVTELVIEKVRKAGGVVDTRTIIPIDSHTRPSVPSDRAMAKGFVFVQSEAGREQDLMRRLLELPEVVGVHLLFGKADILAELEVEKSFVSPPPRRIANIVETRVAKLHAVHDTDTYVPLESVIK
jgi:DNA-binding Lrp family transcriptional regulator